MIKIYSQKSCPDCVNVKANLDAYKIPYEEIDIFDSLPNMKQFLKLRDHEDIYQEVKQNGSIGIPTIVKEDGTLTLNWQDFIKECGYEPVEVHTDGQACDINHKGNC